MNKLPSGYQQVEYIQSSGTQYIDTNYTVNNNNTIETKIELLEKNSDNKMIFGTRSGASSNNISINATNDIVLDFNNSSYANYRATYNYQVNTPYILYSSKNRRVIYSNNKEQILAENSTVCSDTITTSVNSYIFYINPKPADTWYLAKMKLYYLKIYENDNLVRNFIPCYRKSDNEIGLYDIVNDVFYTNQGTGTFLRGDNITVADKLSYLRETKEQIKNKINFLTGELTDETPFREYTNALDNLYSELPKTSQDGTSITLANTRRGKITITPKGNTVQAILPSEYQQVEYIESARTQYIDTGVNADYKLSVFAEMAILSDGAMGAIYNDGSLYIRHHFNYNVSQGIRYYYKAVGGDFIQLIAPSDVDANKHTYLVDIYNNIKQIDESSPESIRTRDSFDTTLNYYLFSRNSNSASLRLALPIQLYSFKMYYENVLVRDFIPCYRKSDNEIGLYDLVNNVFYTNEGTGTFAKGNDIPNPDYPQNIKVVTGENTIHIGNITKTLNLGNIELAKIGDYSDLIFKNEKTNPYYDSNLIENAWYKKEKIKKVNGRDFVTNIYKFDKSTAYSDTTYLCCFNNNFKTVNDYVSGPLYCTHFDSKKHYAQEKIANNMYLGSSSLGICVLNTDFSSATELNEYFSENDIIAYLPKQTSSNIQITDTTLINQLEELNKVIGQGGTVIVETESEEENAQLIVNASALASFENS